MLKRRVVAVCLVALLSQLSLFAQDYDRDLLERIRKEEAANSQIMKTMHMLTDVYGARFTGSPNHKAAAQWAIKQMQDWGLENAHLEPAGPKILTARQIDEQVDKFLKENGALLRVNDAGREHGQIRAFNNRTFDVNKALPAVVMRNEDYGRIARLLGDGREVTLEFNIVNHVYPEGRTSYNTIAEIRRNR